MPSSTARLALPIPLDADPFDDGALATRNLANAVDLLIAGKARRGRSSAGTDAAGDITITHGLGQTPTAVIVSSGRNDISAILAAHTFTSTTFKVRGRVSNTGAIWGTGTSLTVDWLAIA